MEKSFNVLKKIPWVSQTLIACKNKGNKMECCLLALSLTQLSQS